MSVAIIYSQAKPKSRVGALILDAMVNESHEFTRSVTQFPVQEGAPITDHVRHEPTKITIEGLITNTPTTYSSVISQFFYDIASGRERTLNETSYTRVSGAFDLLMEMIKEADTYDVAPKAMEPIDVVTTMRLYKDMLITSLTINKDKPEDCLRFTMSLQKVRRARKRTVLINPAVKTESGVAGAVDDKNNVSDTVSDKETKEVSGIAYDKVKQAGRGLVNFVNDYLGPPAQ